MGNQSENTYHELVSYIDVEKIKTYCLTNCKTP